MQSTWGSLSLKKEKMMIKYRTSYWKDGIEAREVEKETEKSVFYVTEWKGRKSTHREAKVSSYHRWFDSWEEAHTYLTGKAELSLSAAKNSLRDAEEWLQELSVMQKPS
jgi:hypothetical protein